MGADPHESSSARRDAIVDAAATVFLRYGFRKTSMDDLARSAGLSRQGLYLHFETKEALFEAAVLRLVARSRQQHQAALGRTDLALEERLLGAFEAIHGHTIAAPMSQHMDELLATADALVGPLVHELEKEFVTGVAAILARARIAAAWKSAGVSARDLAELLYAASAGLKHVATTTAVYRARMRTALKIVVAGRAGQ